MNKRLISRNNNYLSGKVQVRYLKESRIERPIVNLRVLLSRENFIDYISAKKDDWVEFHEIIIFVQKKDILKIVEKYDQKTTTVEEYKNIYQLKMISTEL